MITFATIAKTGEVEVNSIAPGIAGALLATVAGLVVAIPALFIYSYLNARIKDSIAVMQTFIEELISKMAEFIRKGGASHESRGRQELRRHQRDADGGPLPSAALDLYHHDYGERSGHESQPSKASKQPVLDAPKSHSVTVNNEGKCFWTRCPCFCPTRTTA